MGGKDAFLFLFAPLFWRRKAAASITIKTTTADASSYINQLMNTNKFTIKKFDPNSSEGTKYMAKHGATIYSWGENIQLGIKEAGNGYCTINCKSACVFPQWVDYGINKKNVNALLGGLSNELKDYSKPIFKAKGQPISC
jgi:hypothetical protein